MNDEQIKEEAKRRFEKMTDQEKRDFMELSNEEEKLLNYVEKVGYKQLNEVQQRKFRKLLMHQSARSLPGGVVNSALSSFVNENFNITKDDLRKGGQKNPFKAHLYKDIIVALVMNIGAGALALAGIGPAAVVVEASTGIIAMDFARQLKNYFDFKKLQKMYMEGTMDEEEIKGEIINNILVEGNKRWYR